MTTVELLFSHKRIVGFEVSGHTGYADEGSDIVCSAISALTQTAVLGLQELVGLSPALDVDEGSMYCMLPANTRGDALKNAQLILDTMALGLSSIADTYGDYISIVEREV